MFLIMRNLDNVRVQLPVCHESQRASTRSRIRMPKALAIRNRASTETVRCPFSSSEMKTTDNPVRSARDSCVNRACLRCARMVSPSVRRCFGIEGTIPYKQECPESDIYYSLILFLRTFGKDAVICGGFKRLSKRGGRGMSEMGLRK